MLAAEFSGSIGLQLAIVGVFVAVTATVLGCALWLPRLITRHRLKFDRAVEVSLRSAFLFVDPASLHRLMILAAVLFAVLAMWVTGSLLAAAISAALAGLLPRVVLARTRRRHIEAFRAQFPDLLMLICGSLRAGNALQQAISAAANEIAGPARNEIALMLREQRLGTSLADSLAALQRRLQLEETALFAAALRMGLEAGGNVADALETLADVSRRKLAIEGKIRALTAQGRLQAIVMALLPSALALVVALVDPRAMEPLLAQWQGWVVCGVVLAAQLAGYLMIRRLVLIEV